VAGHKFRVGQKVTLASNVLDKTEAGGGYVVTKQLPEQGGEVEYRMGLRASRAGGARERAQE